MSLEFTHRINGEVTLETALLLQKTFIGFAEKGAKNIILRIDSPGGNVEAGLLIHEVIKNSAVPITGVAEGECGSIAFTILQACKSRGSLPDTKFRVHFLSFYTSAVVFYNESAMEVVRLKHIGLQEEIIKIHLNRGRLSREKLIDLMLKDANMSTQKAMDLGMIDAIVLPGRQP